MLITNSIFSYFNVNIYCILKMRDRVAVELFVAKRPRPKGSLYYAC